MAGLAVAGVPDRLETQALGSCIGIVLYDPHAKVGGLAHAMLPDLHDAKENSRGNLAKFVNTAIDVLVENMVKKGANPKFIKAKLAGGANMFPEISADTANLIGNRNIAAAREALKKVGIPVVAEEIGGNCGRTITMDTITGKLTVRTIAHGEKEI
jgi:chemotaxis protein CheD